MKALHALARPLLRSIEKTLILDSPPTTFAQLRDVDPMAYRAIHTEVLATLERYATKMLSGELAYREDAMLRHFMVQSGAISQFLGCNVDFAEGRLNAAIYNEAIHAAGRVIESSAALAKKNAAANDGAYPSAVSTRRMQHDMQGDFGDNGFPDDFPGR